MILMDMSQYSEAAPLFVDADFDRRAVELFHRHCHVVTVDEQFFVRLGREVARDVVGLQDQRLFRREEGDQ